MSYSIKKLIKNMKPNLNYPIEKLIKNVNRNFSYLVPIIFFLVSFLVIRNHEMWRDEIQAWLLVKDSSNLINLSENLKYEGSPGLWHYLLFPLTRFFNNPYSMQFLHIFISSLSIFFIFKCAPFNKIQKIFLSTSYFIFYEYSIITRSYGLSALLIFIFCSLFKDRNKNKIKMSFILFLLSHTSLFGLIFAFCLLMTIIIEEIITGINNKKLKSYILRKSNLIAISITLSGFITSVLQLLPPNNSPLVNTNISINTNLNQVFNVIQNSVKSYIPIPYFELSFWGTSFSRDSDFLKILIVLFFISIVWIYLVYFKQKPSIFFLYLSGSGLFISFFIFKYIGSIRHHGFLFLTLLSCLWLYKYCSYFRNKKERNTSNLLNRVNIATTFLFLIQAFAGIFAASIDYLFPFSSAKETAIFIKENNLSNSEIIGYQDFAASAVLGHMNNRKSFYYIQRESDGSFIIWDNKREKEINYEILLSESKKLFLKGNNVILVLNSSLKDLGFSEKYFDLIFTSKDSIVKTEKFYIYQYIN